MSVHIDQRRSARRVPETADWALRLLIVAVMLLLGIGAGAAQAAQVLASADRNPVSIEESFNLVFTADEEPDSDPDFSPLSTNFEVLSQGKSTQINMVNGRLNRRTEWTVTVLARMAGDLVVPEIRFGSDRSQPFTMTILQGRARHAPSLDDAPLQLEVEAEPKNPYVQAQVVYTLRLLHQVALRNGQLEDPKVDDAMVQKLGEDRRYQFERGGRRFGVIERRFAIFPQRSGPLRIEPIGLEAELSSQSGSMFDQFFGGRGRVMRVRSEPVVLNVRPIPSAFRGKHWLPASNLQLAQAWSSDPPSTKVGEPITRTLTVRGEGVTMGMLPELGSKELAAEPELKQYPDQPALSEDSKPEGLIGTRREKSALIPMKAGSFSIPGVEIPWWNTRTDRLEIARLPVMTLSVAPSAQAPPPQDEIDASGLVPPELKQAPPATEPQAVTANSLGVTSNPWFWATCLCAAGWLATLCMWYFRRAPEADTTKTAPAKGPDFSAVLKELKRACVARDAESARRAVLAWGAVRWPSDPPASCEAIASRLGGPAHGLLAGLDRALYGMGAFEWDGSELYRWFAEQSRSDHAADGSSRGIRGSRLEPLYRS